MPTAIAIIAAATGIVGIVMAVRVQLCQRADQKMLKAMRLEADERKRELYKKITNG